MKNIFSIILATLLFVGCEEGFLDVPPVDRISETAVWSDEGLAQAYVNAQYDLVASHLAPGNEPQHLNRYVNDAYSSYNFGNAESLRDGSLTPDNPLAGVMNYWETGFSYLKNINDFFDKIEEATEFDADKVSSMKGEMAFLRAYIYQTLLYSYGEVPIIDYVFSLNEDLTGITRDSYDDVFDFIMTDLDYVINESALPDKQSGSDWGRVSKDVARAFKSRLLLRDASIHYNPSNDETKWQAASDAALELIESGRYQLWTGDYRTMFLTQDNGEAIWQKCYNAASGHSYGYRSNATNVGGYGVDQPSENLNRAYEMTNGELPYAEGDEASLNPTINSESGFDPERYWENRDARWYALFGYNERPWAGIQIYTWDGSVGHDNTMTGYYTVKYIDPSGPWSESYPYTTPFTIIRYAEILLNYAEAQFELGFEDVAREYLNIVRQRAGQPGVPATLTGEDLRNKVYHERRVEFPFEMLRFYDIRRWEIAEEEMSQPLIGMKVTNDGTTVAPGPYSYEFYQLLPGNWDDTFYNMPIPRDEIQRSGGSLEQNPGYN